MWSGVLFLLSLSFSHAQVGRELFFEVPENAPPLTLVGTISAPAPPFLIVGLAPELSVEQSSGEIRTKTKLDREARDSYSFVAIPINGQSVRVVISVKDVNDNAPIFPQAHMSVEFPENVARDVKRALGAARDKDLGIFNTQRYVIASGNLNNAFRLSSHRERDGILYLDLEVNGILDRETIGSYELIVDAYDGGTPPLKGSMKVSVSLSDVNDNSPIFNQSRYFGTIPENATVGTSVLQVFAEDPDSGVNGEINYSINRRQTDKDTVFSIDEKSGIVRLIKELDFESKETHEIVVVARDNGLQPLASTIFVSIRVLDIADHAPLLSLVFLTEDGSPRVSENATPGQFIARLSLTDSSSNASYTLKGTQSHFSLTNRNKIEYILVSSPNLDRETVPEYEITVTAHLENFNVSKSFKLLVSDVNDNAPRFLESSYEGTVGEDAEVGTSILQVYAIDGDIGNNSLVSYELEEESNWFGLDSLTGNLYLKVQVKCEREAMPVLRVIARDQGVPQMSSVTEVQILVKDINDNAPVFKESFYKVYVKEGTLRGTCILKVSASDPDCGVNSIVNYTLHETQLVPFKVDSSTGDICLYGDLDYEEKDFYEFYVTASDIGGLSSSAVVKIFITDLNDNGTTHYKITYKSILALSLIIRCTLNMLI